MLFLVVIAFLTWNKNVFASEMPDCSDGEWWDWVADKQSFKTPYIGCYGLGQGKLVKSLNKKVKMSSPLGIGTVELPCHENIYTVVGEQTFTPWAAPNGLM